MDKQEMLDADPFVYGAKRFNVDYCSCIVSETKTLEFTKNYSKFIIRNTPSYNYNQFNLTKFEVTDEPG